ncbi:hypothetical protein PABG_12496 [Paracoccidioides brasiliensis Pb03]|nr:hypothetical protein PABG_12496 [Paracoccidioides brasiliensis Pb03]
MGRDSVSDDDLRHLPDAGATLLRTRFSTWERTIRDNLPGIADNTINCRPLYQNRAFLDHATPYYFKDSSALHWQRTGLGLSALTESIRMRNTVAEFARMQTLPSVTHSKLYQNSRSLSTVPIWALAMHCCMALVDEQQGCRASYEVNLSRFLSVNRFLLSKQMTYDWVPVMLLIMDTSARQTFSWVTGEVQPLHSECPATAMVKWLVGSLVPEKFKVRGSGFNLNRLPAEGLSLRRNVPWRKMTSQAT